MSWIGIQQDGRGGFKARVETSQLALAKLYLAQGFLLSFFLAIPMACPPLLKNGVPSKENSVPIILFFS
jgi:hypothetical protein